MDIYSILSHPFRRKILLLLEKEGYIPYTDLMEKLGLETTGQLNFHLKKIGSLIGKDKKSYFLTEDGKRVLKILNLNKRILSGEDIDEYLDSKGSEISRIGVFICNCNTEISSVIDITALENYVNKLRKVVSVKIFENLCQQKNFEKICKWVKDNFLNKIVIAACSPKTHQLLFERIFEDIIDRTNIEIANIREQSCWVHQFKLNQIDPSLSLEKTKLLIEAAVERVHLQKKVKVKRVEVEKSCAILGGGIAGITLALNLARAGIKVYLIEKSPTLGGKVARWHRIHNMGDCSICFISELIGELANEKNIKIFTNTEIENVSGELGNFLINMIKKPRYIDMKKCTGCKQCIEVCSIEKPNQYEFGLINRKIIYIPFMHSYPYIPLIDEEDLKNCLNCRICERACVNKAIDLTQKEEMIEIKVGTKVIAIGSDLYGDLEDYYYNPKKNIITSPEFERILSSDGLTEGKLLRLSDKKPINTISIIQEVGPSKYLADYSENLAEKYIEDIKIRNLDCEVNIFYDLSKLKDKDEILLRSTNPRFIYANKITIESNKDQNHIIADNIEFPSDLIVLNLKYVPNKDLKNLRKLMDFTLDENGFMSEETLASGIYGVGTIFGPLDYNSTISTANNIALKIISLLSKNYLIAEYTGIEFDENKCGLCGLCLKICPYNAITIESDKVSIDKFKCKGCGTCASICPTNAIDLNIDTSEKILATIEIFSKFRTHPKIIAFCCASCGYAAADNAGLKKISYNPNIFIVRVPCTGRIDTNFIIKSFELGFDGVMIIGCRQDACRYIDGIKKVENKIRLLRNIISPKYKDRIILEHMNAVEGKRFAEISIKFYNQLLEEIKYEA
ncbi:MAG: hydrogenase iron-sulfur subunit [Candidatus Lokiarchaeota archaeon]|nr:hydrogenase iron-sulfur subunit [Candidatus Lokiarchaeota archaeon]